MNWFLVVIDLQPYLLFLCRVSGMWCSEDGFQESRASSWRICQDQVSGYSNNSYRGYETLEKAHQEYESFLDDEAMAVQAIDQSVPLAQLPPEAVH